MLMCWQKATLLFALTAGLWQRAGQKVNIQYMLWTVGHVGMMLYDSIRAIEVYIFRGIDTSTLQP